MKRFGLIILLLIMCSACKQNKTNHKSGLKESEALLSQLKSKPIMQKQSIHQFVVKDLSGNDFDFSMLKGKKVMIVNTASECGFTPQYKDLQVLYETYKNDNFTIIGFPANNFGAQEPGTNAEIATFCQQNYGVSFPVMGKVSVKGDDMHEVYQFLTQKERNGVEDSVVTWNFQKYLIDENGYVVRSLSPKTLPTEASVITWIKE